MNRDELEAFVGLIWKINDEQVVPPEYPIGSSGGIDRRVLPEIASLFQEVMAGLDREARYEISHAVWASARFRAWSRPRTAIVGPLSDFPYIDSQDGEVVHAVQRAVKGKVPVWGTRGSPVQEHH